MRKRLVDNKQVKRLFWFLTLCAVLYIASRLLIVALGNKMYNSINDIIRAEKEWDESEINLVDTFNKDLIKMIQDSSIQQIDNSIFPNDSIHK